jgi:hypothetical protein
LTCEKLYEVLGDVSAVHVQAAHEAPAKRKKPAILKWCGLAACLCLAAVGLWRLLTPGSGARPVLEWSEGFPPADYFAYNQTANGASSAASLADSAIPYASERYFSDDREQMEAAEVIPEMPEYPSYDCVARYNADGSLFSVTFVWHQQGDTYRSLRITAGYQEVQMIQDCIGIEVDEDGNIVPPAVTVTERDGVQIVAEGSEKRDKTLTFQNDTGWYQIEGSWNDSYASLASLLDWVWEHPVDFELFAEDRGVEITYASLEEMPEAFADCIPDFAALGYLRGENYVALKDGVPFRFEGHYYSGVDEAQLEDSSFYSEDGWTEVHWCVDAEPDYYDRQESAGALSSLTEASVLETLSRESHLSFFVDDCLVKVYSGQPEAAWEAIRALRDWRAENGTS